MDTRPNRARLALRLVTSIAPRVISAGGPLIFGGGLIFLLPVTEVGEIVEISAICSALGVAGRLGVDQELFLAGARHGYQASSRKLVLTLSAFVFAVGGALGFCAAIFGLGVYASSALIACGSIAASGIMVAAFRIQRWHQVADLSEHGAIYLLAFILIALDSILGIGAKSSALFSSAALLLFLFQLALAMWFVQFSGDNRSSGIEVDKKLVGRSMLNAFPVTTANYLAGQGVVALFAAFLAPAELAAFNLIVRSVSAIRIISVYTNSRLGGRLLLPNRHGIRPGAVRIAKALSVRNARLATVYVVGCCALLIYPFDVLSAGQPMEMIAFLGFCCLEIYIIRTAAANMFLIALGQGHYLTAIALTFLGMIALGRSLGVDDLGSALILLSSASFLRYGLIHILANRFISLDSSRGLSV